MWKNAKKKEKNILPYKNKKKNCVHSARAVIQKNEMFFLFARAEKIKNFKKNYRNELQQHAIVV